MFVESAFYISFVCLCFMLTFKMIEGRVGEIGWWARMRKVWDDRMHVWREKLWATWTLWKKIAYLFVFEFLPAYAYKQTLKLKDYFYKKYYESAERMKGEKRMLKSNGSVSEFLQNLTEDKRTIVGGQEM